MRDALGSSTILGYCANVHPGRTWHEARGQLERFGAAVREHVVPDGELGVGLWLSAAAAREVIEQALPDELRDCLAENGLMPFTMNGFPHDDFHSEQVKHRVYRPSWSDRTRLAYTLDLAEILAALLPEDAEGSISTLPIGWRAEVGGVERRRAADALATLAIRLERLWRATGRLIHVDLEPEPGCVLDTSSDVVDFFESQLFTLAPEQSVRRHIRVCHDVCHAAVMFEDQTEVMRRYAEAGVRVGKVQISSAIRLRLADVPTEQQSAAIEALSAFDEARYLHQTVLRGGLEQMFFDDLGPAIDAMSRSVRDERRLAECRVHYHVPIFADRIGLLETTADQILPCIDAARELHEVHHFEVETYAWNVLPPPLRADDLAEGIARELVWLLERTGAGLSQ
jgi:hypothetical protein